MICQSAKQGAREGAPGAAMSIEIANLRKSFAGIAAIAGIDLQVAEGEMVVLLGPSGCGKTTTMRCIAGLERPDQGRIKVGGRVVFDDRDRTDIPINQRKVGMVFQSYAIWPHMNVFQNVAFPLEMAGIARAEIAERVGAMLTLMGLDGFAERGASYLSGGQMQRVALARSVVMQPTALLFDEPLSNLDARLRDRLRIQLRELQTQLKITSLYVTHDQREALALADRVVVMEAGRVLQIDDPVSLYGRPRTATIADFLGYTNIFDATILARDGDCCQVRLAANDRPLRAAASAETSDGLAACIRPEDLKIARDPGVGANLPENVLAGEVVLASFLGSHIQFRVRVEGGAIWEALSPAVPTDIRLGARVLLEVPPASLRLLPRH
jgi:iron(III) transport system ATP-binding protein